MKKYLMILGGFTGILFLFTVIPSCFAAPASDTAEPPVATETATIPAETATSTTAEPAGRADLCESYQMLDITSGMPLLRISFAFSSASMAFLI